MGRTTKIFNYIIPQKPATYKGFRGGGYRIATRISSLSRRDALLFQGRESYLLSESTMSKYFHNETTDNIVIKVKVISSTFLALVILAGAFLLSKS